MARISNPGNEAFSYFADGGSLCFDRTGRRLVTIEGDAIAIIDLARSETKRVEGVSARTVAAFDQQVWIANTSDQLVRFDYSGRTIGEPVALEFAATAVLVPGVCGSPAAIWSSAPSIALVEDRARGLRVRLALLNSGILTA